VIRVSARLAGLSIAVVLLSPACGKKGPPLEPLRPMPDRVGGFAAHRQGSTVRLQLTLPSSNQDKTTPADLGRVEIYGFTERAEDVDRRRIPTPRDLRRLATLVTEIEVRPPPPPRRPGEGEDETDEPPEPPPPEPTDLRPGQGDTVSAVEELTEATLVPVTLPRPRQEKPAPQTPPREVEPPKAVAPVLTQPVTSPPLIRTYIAIPVSTRNRDGAPTSRVMVPLGVSLIAPPAPSLTHSKEEIEVSWEPPQGAPRRIQAPPEKGDLRSRPVLGQSSVYTYNVYESAEGDSATTGVEPINGRPLEEPPYADTRIEFGVRRCYAIRSVYSFGGVRIESDPSPPACITPADTFAPAAPAGLAAVGSQGGISLIWEPATEDDLAGYLVLRGEAGSETLQPLTPAPIRETTYRDTDVRPGVRYAYAVVAVDNATPANRSAESERVEESGR
jgi:hypothetical protein